MTYCPCLTLLSCIPRCRWRPTAPRQVWWRLWPRSSPCPREPWPVWPSSLPSTWPSAKARVLGSSPLTSSRFRLTNNTTFTQHRALSNVSSVQIMHIGRWFDRGQLSVSITHMDSLTDRFADAYKSGTCSVKFWYPWGVINTTKSVGPIDQNNEMCDASVAAILVVFEKALHRDSQSHVQSLFRVSTILSTPPTIFTVWVRHDAFVKK